ncbi:hypothetical protein EXIGLDRAFT_766701 [Exidia glandulosa HHB12029]|uniref:F-box domain-containing protein n=1 Tax=Exidia glandulosa HHB12029 TaxID=1314781 RepID=A0A165JKK8_EXIGL|nr:hypothetical protein EXIGLDRAFT_766701 [Exidia glandulosa HHB12029]
MNRPPGVQSLPNELLSRTVSFLDFPSLVHTAHTCAHWRILAFNDPLFWRDIAIFGVENHELDWARLRLDYARDRPINITVDYRPVDEHVPLKLVPLIRRAVPRARSIHVCIESLYRLDLEDALCQAAPHLERLTLLYAAYPPELHLSLPFGKGKHILADTPGRLRVVRLNSIILPKIPTKAFAAADEVFFNNTLTTYQPDFPSYLWDFFPNMTRLRLSGGECHFANAPLPGHIIAAVARLAYLDLKYIARSLPGFFRHLPIHKIPEVLIFCADEDAVYSALDPLRSPFHMMISPVIGEGVIYPEFNITVRGSDPTLVRHLAEPFCDYYPGSHKTNALLENNEFAAQLDDLTMYTTLWDKLASWLPSFALLPKLIVIIDDDSPDAVLLPRTPIPCPALITLVLQAKGDFVYVKVDDLLEFADRLTPSRPVLELRRVVVTGSRHLLSTRFDKITLAVD